MQFDGLRLPFRKRRFGFLAVLHPLLDRVGFGPAREEHWNKIRRQLAALNDRGARRRPRSLDGD